MVGPRSRDVHKYALEPVSLGQNSMCMYVLCVCVCVTPGRHFADLPVAQRCPDMHQNRSVSLGQNFRCVCVLSFVWFFF